ncbi:MAG TPA: hypothetical protein VGJ92_04635 [Methanocella sp.]|jgi:hypothetical protein
MSSFEIPASRHYLKMKFDDEEISVIQTACTAVALRERYLMMRVAANTDLETAAGLAKKASDSEMAEGLASMFKPGQEILIEPEDLAVVLESLKAYGLTAPEEHSPIVKRLIEKMGRYCKQ